MPPLLKKGNLKTYAPIDLRPLDMSDIAPFKKGELKQKQILPQSSYGRLPPPLKKGN